MLALIKFSERTCVWEWKSHFNCCEAVSYEPWLKMSFFSQEEMRIFKEILRKLDSLNENLKCVSEVETKLNTICSLFYIPALLIILCYGKKLIWITMQNDFI